MINNQKQNSGDNSVNYMAAGDIIFNGLTKEDVLELIKELSIIKEISQEELQATRSDIKKQLNIIFDERCLST